MIYQGAKAALRRLGSTPPPDIELPPRLDVEFRTADIAQVATSVKGVSRSGARPVRIAGDDPLEIYRSLIGVTRVARVSGGR